jgi:hypothetical protein
LDTVDQKAWLRTQLTTFADREERTVNLMVAGKSVCYIGFCAAYGVKFGRYYNVRKAVLGNVPEMKHGNYYRAYERQKHDVIVKWLKDYEKSYCEAMPHLNLTYLPSAMDKIELWHLSIAELQKFLRLEVTDCPSYAYFCAVMRDHFPHLRQPRVHQLGRCARCVKLDDQLTTTKNVKQKEIIRGLKLAHYKDFMAQRAHYQAIVDQAARYPLQVTSVVMDHASGTRLPHHHLHPKDWSTKVRPRTNVFGLIDHSNKSKKITPYLDVFAHDSNMVVTQLHQWLQEYRTSPEMKKSRTLHVQGDNATKDNKNRYLFAFLASVVQEKIFDIVLLEMNEKGHTHVDIDALFRAISQWLTKMSSPTFTHYVDVFLPSAYKNYRFGPRVTSVDYVFDVKSFFKPYLLDMKHFSVYRAFKFEVRIIDVILADID